MHPFAIRVLNKARRIMLRDREPANDGPALEPQRSGQAASDLIRDRLLAPRPCMIVRFGRTELRTYLRRWNRVRHGFAGNAWRYVRGQQGPFWWDDEIRGAIRDLSGLFPCTDGVMNRFSDLYLRDIPAIDILGAWCAGESSLRPLFPSAQIVRLEDLEPYYHSDPWTSALEGRTVLAIHPFDASIREQFEKRALLFNNPKMLPPFRLKTLKAVQSLGGGDSGFANWFDALESMCRQIRETDFDVALIGAGAYGLPLAAFIKSLGRKAVHLGGATQILFGIKGRRWDERPFFQQLYNEHWIRPRQEETPACAGAVESACYW
jgi:hypothetical protein